MSIVNIQVTGIPEAIGNLQRAQDLMDNLGEGLLEAVDSAVMPAIEEASTVVWNVRTGQYSAGWYSFLSTPNTVTISNMVDYAAPLEYGWTRGSTFVDSPGVAMPTALESTQAIGEGLATWIQSQLPQ